MRIYRESLKNIVFASVIIFLTAGFLFYFRAPMYEFWKITWNLTIGENAKIVTPEERFAYLEKHPGELKLAMIGDWKKTARSGRPRQNVLSIAIRRINQSGGINGRTITAEWMDVEGSADKLHECVEKIAHDPSYFAIIGPSTSGQLLSVKPLLLTYKLLTFAPAVSNTNATLPGEEPLIFLPNSSDEQDVAVLRDWALENKYSNFILINENQPFSAGYAKYIEKNFFESDILVSARTFFNPTDNVGFFMNELKNYAEFFNVQHALIVNYSAVPNTYELMAKWMLEHTPGVVFSYKLLPGSFSEDEMKRMYSIVYLNKSEKMKFYVGELAVLPDAMQDAFAPTVYQTPYLLADACRKAPSMRQEDVIDVLQHQELHGPFGYFRFNENRFEKDPVIRVVSVYQLHEDWGKVLMSGRKPVRHVEADGKTQQEKTQEPSGK